jgi:hypothetical protein
MSRTSGLARSAVLPVALSLLVLLTAVSVVGVAPGSGRTLLAAHPRMVPLTVAPGHSAVATWSRGFENGRSGFSVRVPTGLDGPLSVGLVLRAGRAGRTGYLLAVDVRPDRSATAAISRITTNRATTLTRVALPGDWRPGATLRVEAGVRGRTSVSLELRAWTDDGVVPDWQVRTRDRARSRVQGSGRVYARARLGSGQSPLTLALRSLAATDPSATTTSDPTTTPDPTTSDPAPSDQFGPLGRVATRHDLDELGWDGVQAPATDSVTVVDGTVPLGVDRPPGTLLRSKLEPGQTYTDGRCRAEVYGRRPFTWTTPPEQWPDPAGSERWYSFSVFVPTAFPVATDTTWLDLTQWKGYHGGTPPLALEIKRSGFRLGGDRANRGLIPDDGKLGAIAFGRWTRFTVGIHLSTSAADGWVEVYQDGELMLPRTAVATMDTYEGEPDPVYLKQGIYRSSAWQVTQVLYFSPMTITESVPASP